MSEKRTNVLELLLSTDNIMISNDAIQIVGLDSACILAELYEISKLRKDEFIFVDIEILSKTWHISKYRVSKSVRILEMNNLIETKKISNKLYFKIINESYRYE
jgi:hypothetical protein